MQGCFATVTASEAGRRQASTLSGGAMSTPPSGSRLALALVNCSRDWRPEVASIQDRPSAERRWSRGTAVPAQSRRGLPRVSAMSPAASQRTRRPLTDTHLQHRSRTPELHGPTTSHRPDSGLHAPGWGRHEQASIIVAELQRPRLRRFRHSSGPPPPPWPLINNRAGGRGRLCARRRRSAKWHTRNV